MRHSLTRHLQPGVVAVIAAVAGVLVACGSDQTAGIQGTGAPVAASVTSVGPISGFGSIIQGGVEYQTSGAQIQIEDRPGTEDELQVGDVITINGTVNTDGATGVATSVSYACDLRGPVTQVDAAGGTFTVLEQIVRITDETLFDDVLEAAGLDGIQAAAVLEVSGVRNAAGEIVASRVQLDDAGAPLQVKGPVQALDTTARTFRIAGLTVDYSNAALNGTLASSSTVIVRGTGVTNGVLTATDVRVVGVVAMAANGNGRFEGLITSFTSNSDFAVGTQRVTSDSSTVFDLGGAILGVDVPVRVRGTFNASGVLVASRVEVKAKSLSLVRGLVDGVSTADNTLTVMGVTITVGANTSFDDKSSQKLRSFSLADVRTGDYVEVRGVPGGSAGALVATLVERNKPEERVRLQGLAANVANPEFTILGVPVMTNEQTKFNGPGGAQQFFADAAGQVVKVRGTFTGGVVVADQVQIKH